MKNRFNPLLQAVVVMSAFTGPIQAGVIYWDGTSSTANADGGNGTWGTVLTNWDSLATSGADTTWPSAGTDNDAVFAGSAGIVTIDTGGVIANDLTFSTTGYTIGGAGLTLNGTLPVINVTGTATINSSITSAVAGGFSKSGAGTLVLGGANTFAAGTTLAFGTGTTNSGAIRIANGSALSGITTITSANNNTGVSRLELIGGITVTGTAVNTGGRSNQQTTGAILANVSGNNEWVGAITITGAGGGYGIRSDAGTLTLSGGLRSNTATRTWEVGGAGDIVISGVIGGSTGSSQTATLSLTKFGAGTVTLSNANTHGGSTRINAGTLLLTNTSALVNSTVDMNFADTGTLSFGPSLTTATFGALTGSRNLSLLNTNGAPAAVTLSVGNASATSYTYTGALSGGNLYKIGSGTGTFTLDPGTGVSVSINALSANVGGALILKSGNIGTTGIDPGQAAYNMGAGARGGTLTIDGAALTVGGTGTKRFVIGAAANGTGNLINGSITASDVVIGHNGAATMSQSGGTVTTTNVYHQDGGSGAYTLTGGNLIAQSIYNNTASTQSFTLSLNGGTLKAASGTTSLIKDNNVGTQISVLLGTGNTQIDTSLSSATIARPMGDISGQAGTFTKIGANTLTLSGANTYSGGTTVNEGSLTVGTGGTLGATTGSLAVNNANTAAGTAVVLNLPTAVDTTVGNLNGTLATPISGTNTATINTQTGRNFSVNQTAAGTYAGVIAGAGSFSVGSLSTNTLTLTGANSYTGVTTINAGTLALASGGSLSDSTAVVVNASGSFDISGISTSERIASLTGATGSSLKIGANTLEFGDANNTSFTGSIDSIAGGELKKIGAGIFTLAASGYTYPVTGPNINISQGTLLTGTGNLPTSSAFTLSGGALNTGTFSNTVGSLSVTAGSVIDFAGGGTPILTFTSQGSWTGLLQIWNWTGSAGSVGTGGTLKFLDGSNGTLIDPSKIQFYSGSGTGSIGSGGVFIGTELVPVPEATTLLSCSMLFGLVVFQRRRQVGRAKVNEA